MAEIIEKAADIGVQNPIHLLTHDPDRESIQCILGTLPRPEPIREAYKVLFIDLLEDRSHCLLDNLVLQCGYSERALPPIWFRYVNSS